MNFQYNLFNVLMLFGAIQGMILCVYLYLFEKKPLKKQSPFLLFLFSLAFINLYYSLMDIGFFAYFRALHVSPYPSKWLIAPALLLYCKKLFQRKTAESSILKKYFFFLPAFLINIPYYYWFTIAWKENSYRIVRVIIDTDFFRYNEVLSILFSLLLLIYSLGYIKQQAQSYSFSKKEQKRYKYLKALVWICICIFVYNLLLVIIDLGLREGQETRSFYYSLWMLHSLFIYTIGWLGFSGPAFILYPFKRKEASIQSIPILERLEALIQQKKLYQNPDFRIADAAALIGISTKELSGLINNNLGYNFSTYINHFRIEEIKEKLISEEHKKYTLQHIALSSGFKSKSSFNEIFKNLEGMTPSAYRKAHSN